MQTRLPYSNGYSRSVKIDPFTNEGEPARHESISVFQQSSIHNMTLEWPEVSWASIGAVSPIEAEKFADALKYAATIARLWANDTGHAIPWPEMEAVLPASQ